MTTLLSNHPAVKEHRTVFMKSVKAPDKVKRLLQPANTNSKMGGGKNIITRGRWRGMPLFLLTLEERKTCPKTCQQWESCYGNNMPFANRIDHGSKAFLPALSSELSYLATRYPKGFVVRLHVLGDFFTAAYARFWESSLKKYPQLRIYGYTHRDKNSAVGKVIQRMNAAGAWVRWSDAGGPMSANVDGEGIQCPQEVGLTDSCLTCGLCWQTTKPIKFLKH